MNRDLLVYASSFAVVSICVALVLYGMTSCKRYEDCVNAAKLADISVCGKP